jgi:two-component system LytT family response regulator
MRAIPMLKILVIEEGETKHYNMDLLLSGRTDVSSIHYAYNSEQATSALKQEQFDLVLLDIQMPLKIGLEVALHIQSNTTVVFITSSDIDTDDYVLKPFETERFHVAIEQAVECCNVNSYVQMHLFERLIKKRMTEKVSHKTSKLALKEVGKIKLINPDNIKFIKGAGNYVEIVLMNNNTLLHRETLRDIEARLCNQKFSRIHKSTIVRNDLIVELRPTPKGDYAVKLNSGEELMLSRRNKSKLKLFLN